MPVPYTGESYGYLLCCVMYLFSVCWPTSMEIVAHQTSRHLQCVSKFRPSTFHPKAGYLPTNIIDTIAETILLGFFLNFCHAGCVSFFCPCERCVTSVMSEWKTGAMKDVCINLVNINDSLSGVCL